MNGQNDQITALLSEWAAPEASGDTATLKRCLADDFTGVGPLGFTLSRQDWLARHATGALQYDTFQIEDVQVRVYGDTVVAIAVQKAGGAYQGNEVPGDLRATPVLVNTSGAWRLTGIHMSFMSFIAGTPDAPPIPGRPTGSSQ
jgi:ketosteroid isomerase-like protein